ncbi:MAG: thioredoxin domain-containing protein, partial [Firmicutes bacterium]|nr:thioredoxin domain-containing protein [Bacillota bacterium]
MLDVSKENFENEVLQAEGVIVVDFWGPKCAPCKALMPAMEELANKYGDRIKFCKLNTTENMRLAIAQKVSGLPTVIVYKDGKQIAQLTT